MSAKVQSNLDVEELMKKRRENFKILSHALCNKVQPLFTIEEAYSVPLYFPILVEDRASLQTHLVQNAIYAPIVWPKDEKQQQSDKKNAYKDNTDRIGVERFFSLGKRCNGMGLITTRLEETSITVIALSILVTNLFRHMDAKIFFIFYLTNETDEPGRYFALFDVDEDELGACR